MGWNGAMEDNRRMLTRIVALLYAFAVLAERLSSRRNPRCEPVLWALRSAEMVAREFVVEAAFDQGAPEALVFLMMHAMRSGDNPDDPMRLATSFIALAVVLDRLADETLGLHEPGISKLCNKLAACAAAGHLWAGTSDERSRLSLAGPWFAIGRRDSS